MSENDIILEEEAISCDGDNEVIGQVEPDEITLLKEEIESLRAELLSRDELEKNTQENGKGA